MVIKVPIIIAVLIVMMIVSLKLVERYPEPLRQGFEDYLSRAYGTSASIGQLEDVTFFPNIHVRARDITMHSVTNAALMDMSVDYIDIEAPLISMFLGTGKVKNLEIQTLKATKNFILPQALEIQNLLITDKNGPDQYGAFLIVDGHYANQDMKLEAELEKSGDLYKMNNLIPFSFSLGEAKINAHFEKKKDGKVLLKNTVYSLGEIENSEQDYILFEDNNFNDNNPLACLINKAQVKDCKQHLQ